MKRIFGLVLAALLLAAVPALAYVIKFKDGTSMFALEAFTVEGTMAIITLENGTKTKIPRDKIDVPATEAFNEKYKGANVRELDTPTEKMIATPQPTALPGPQLQDLIRKKKAAVREVPAPSTAPKAAEGAGGTSGAPVDRPIEEAFNKFFEGAGITQYHVTNYGGKPRLLSTANSEEAVFIVLSAAARAVADLADKGKDSALDIVLTTSSGENAGSFAMSPEEARSIVNGQLTVGDFFVKHVAL